MIWATRVWAWLLRLAGSPWGAVAVVIAALAIWLLEKLAWPFGPGRDFDGYVRMYVELFQADPIYPYAVLLRPPVSPIVVGVPLELGGAALAAVFAALYAGSILAWSAAAAVFGRAAAVVTAISLLLYPGYGAIFHGASSDAPFAAAFALLALVLSRAVVAPSGARFAGVGLALALATLTRPVGQALVWLCLAPLVVARSWRPRLGWTAGALAAMVVPLGLWVAHNAVRFDDVTFVRGGSTAVPLLRAFLVDRIVHPDNGPATEKLARLVQRDLLPNEPYRSYGITLDEFFSSGSHRMLADVGSLIDRTQGWDSDYVLLADVGREAVLRHPVAYAKGVTKTFFLDLWKPLYGNRRPAPASDDAQTGASSADMPGGLPIPSEGEPIPSARQEPYTSTPDNSIRQVWTSPTEKHLEFDDPTGARRARTLDLETARLTTRLDPDPGIELLGKLADGSSRVYPRPLLLLLAGVAAVIIRRPRRVGLALVLTGAGLTVVAVGALGVGDVVYYAVPVVPAFLLLAVAGLVGERRRAALTTSIDPSKRLSV